MALQVNIPALPDNATEDELRDWADQVKLAIETILDTALASVAKYTVTNNTTTRSLDCTGVATVTQVAQVLGTLINDLGTKGILG